MFYERIFRELTGREIRYLVIGGIAVNLHGFSRATGDLDIMLSFDKDNLERFVGLVKALEFRPRVPVRVEELADPSKWQIWKKEKHAKVFSVYNPENEMEHIDVMLENYIDFDRAYENRKVVTARNIPIPIISIGDLIKLKEIAGRERDKIDIRALLKIRELGDEREKKY